MAQFSVLVLTITVVIGICTINLISAKPRSYPTMVTRAEWGAKAPKEIQELHTPVPNVVIHHSSSPAACYTKEACCSAMRSMQTYHQDVKKWADIGYNFGVGSDGRAYEGRGWSRLGAHARGFNTQSLGIVLIGNWNSVIPLKIQLQAAQGLIKEGVDLGWISPDYNLVGHRQIVDTDCPGNALFKEISTWKHFNGSILTY